MKILIGNIFDTSMKTLVNTVNCVGVMGKGIALEFKKRFPDIYKEYVKLCDQKLVRPGKPFFYQDLLGTSVLMFPTKDHWRSPSKLEYIVDGLNWFVENYQQLGITSIAFPPLGCGNGGLTWDVVGPIMYNKLSSLPIDIEIYAPFGTKSEQLTVEYLSTAKVQDDAAITGNLPGGFNDRWLMILEVIRKVNEGKYTLHVGRVILQKICYILTRCGIQTGFTFVKSWYGLYAEQVHAAISALSNANLILEKQAPHGKMIEVHVSPSFVLQRKNYSAAEIESLDSCIDLFCRIKNTDQAEMIATIIYEYDELKKNSENVSEQDVLDGVMTWKKRWIGQKENEVKAAIKDLAMLGWIKPIPSYAEEEYLF